jgi:LacI family repressor for deo operon, udp, cdd, tsx, nupC, and nupG
LWQIYKSVAHIKSLSLNETTKPAQSIAKMHPMQKKAFFACMKKRSTIYDIARELGIAPASVSRALHDNPLISEATRNLVKKTAIKLNYKRNQHASNLRTGGSKTLGVVVPRINNNFFSTLIAGIESVAHKNKYHVIISQSDEDAEKERAAVETLVNQNVACIMISLASSTRTTTHLKQAIKNQVPVIQFDRADENLNTNKVLNETQESVFELIKHLADQGYKRIAHLAGPQHINIFKERKEAYELGLKKMKLQKSASLIIYDALSREAAKEATMKLLKSTNPPDAIFAAADLAALGALEAARTLKIQVPNDLGICGFSNEPYTEVTTPAITTINQFSYNMGEAVANMFFEKLHTEDKKALAFSKIIDAKLVIRESTMRK